MLKNEKSANRNDHQNRKTDLKNNQNRKTENPNAPLINWSLLKIYSLIENLFIWKSLDVDEDEVLDEVSIHEFIVYLWGSCSLIEFLRSLLRSHFAGKPLVLSKDVGCFSGFKIAAQAQKHLSMAIEMKRKAITMLW